MGTNSSQAAGVLVFLLAFVVLAESFFSGAALPLIGLVFGLLTASAVIFLRAKRMEQASE